jgi:hypothetical protein
MVILAISPARSARAGHGGCRDHDLVNRRHFIAELSPSVRPIILLQMLGVWAAAAWPALASVSSWMR